MGYLEFGDIPASSCCVCGNEATHFIFKRNFLSTKKRLYCLKDWLVEIRINGLETMEDVS